MYVHICIYMYFQFPMHVVGTWKLKVGTLSKIGTLLGKVGMYVHVLLVLVRLNN